MQCNEKIKEECKNAMAFQCERLARWEEIADKCEHLLRGFELLGASIDFYSALRISITGNKDTLIDSFRVFRLNGYNTNDQRPTDKPMSSWEGIWRKKDFPDIFFNFSSNVCKLVKVGEKEETRKVPIYDIQCEGETVASGVEKPDDTIPF